jgi:serine/threonine protein kinase
MGTLAYMSPEQLKAAEVGPATDIYAFGLVLYEMATGVKAFPDSGTMGAAFRRTTEPPPSPRAVAPELSAAWESAILGCLQIEPEARFQNAAAVIDILDGAPLPALRRKRPPAAQHSAWPHSPWS